MNAEEKFDIDSIINDHYRKNSQTVLEPSFQNKGRQVKNTYTKIVIPK